MLDAVILAQRQSPDWAALARDYRAGVPIDPARYVPDHAIPAFPADIVGLIGRWNDFAAVDFFTCRAELKAIAAAVAGRVVRAVRVPADRVPEAVAALAGRRFAVCFHDDDDWFAPDVADRLGRVDASGADVLVFPLPRFSLYLCTFVPPGHAPAFAVGRPQPFSNRYQTNNYALLPHLCTPAHLPAMQDHISASAHADATGLADRFTDTLIGVTNKTPCSASFLPLALTDAAGFRNFVGGTLQVLHQVTLPAELGWTRAPLDATLALLGRVMAGMRT
jgi:hypothetical protein